MPGTGREKGREFLYDERKAGKDLSFCEPPWREEILVSVAFERELWARNCDRKPKEKNQNITASFSFN